MHKDVSLTILFIELEVRFEEDLYMAEEGASVTNIRLLATDFAENFTVQIFVFTLDADVAEKEVEADISELALLVLVICHISYIS